jgi:hypothetical protein
VPESTGEPVVKEVDPVVEAAKPPPTEPTTIALEFAKGRRETYTLANEITTHSQGLKKGEVFVNKSFLTAEQIVEAHDDKGLVTIQTINVKGGVNGTSTEEQEANDFIARMAESIEGSILRGRFNSAGKGSELELLGEGVGLNPLGPQAGSQTVMVGFMGVLLPEKAVKPGDKWTGTYDVSQSAADLFATQGGRANNGEIPITYELLDYNEKTNFFKVKITGKGTPVIKVPMGGAMATINMDVSLQGQALVRLDDGWLQELRVETTVVTEGFVATKQVVKTLTRRNR